jgi:hypothetical protein
MVVAHVADLVAVMARCVTSRHRMIHLSAVPRLLVRVALIGPVLGKARRERHGEA